MKHEYRKSSECTHSPDDERICPVCQGLAICKVCHGGEGELPTDCPGVPMTEAQRTAVHAGMADFINGHWSAK